MPQAILRNITTAPAAPSRAVYERDVLTTLAGLFTAPAANDAATLTVTACPCCGSTPAPDPRFHKRAVVYCNNDDCSERPQAMGDNLALAAATWNQRIQDGELV